MPYGVIKVDQVTFTNAGVDQTISVSGIVASISGNITATGTISGNVIRGGTVSGATVTGTAGRFGTVTGNTAGFTTVTGTTVTGTTASFTSGVFTSISGGTHTITSGVFASGTAAAPSITFTGDLDTGVYASAANQVAITTSGTERMRIDSTGKVGIGTSSPARCLDVTPSSANTVAARFGNIAERGLEISTFLTQSTSDAGVAFNARGAGNGAFAFQTDSTERLRIDSNGRVGIGTSSPGTTLDLGSGTLRIKNASADTSGLQLYQDASDVSRIYNYYNGPIALGTNNTERLRIDSNGRVGIGTSSPGANHILEIEGGQKYLAVRTNAGAGGVANPSSSDGLFFTWNRSNGGGESNIVYGTGLGTSPGLTFGSWNGTTYTERARIDSSGRLGIGTSSPQAPLHVIGVEGVRVESTTSSDGHIRFINTSGSMSIGMSGAVGNNLLIYDRTNNQSVYNYIGGASGYHAWNVNNTERLRIDSSGRVGIGTSSPAAALDVVGAGLPNCYISTTKADASPKYSLIASQQYSSAAEPEGVTVIGSELTPSANNIHIGGFFSEANASTSIVFSTASSLNTRSGSERMRIDSSGRLLVGTSNTKTAARPFLGTSNQITPISQIEGYQIYTDEASRCFMLRGNSTSDIYPYFALVRSKGTALGSNTTVASGDNIGALSFQGMDGTNPVEAASIVAMVDGTPGANDMPGRLVFSTTADGASSPTERMRIGSNGLSILFVSTADGFQTRNSAAAGNSYACFAGRHSATSTQDGTLSFVVWTNGNVENSNNSYGAFSDAKLKENIVDANSQWNDIKALQVRNYNLKEGQTHRQIGLIAQEVEPISPGLVYESPDRDEDGNDLGTVTKSVNYSVLYMKAVKALQEAIARIETLEQQVATLLP